MLEMGRPKRIGGEISTFIDRLGPPQPWRQNWLPFSNGRAALAWFIEVNGIKSAVICAYTCPSIPSFLYKHGIATETFDVWASSEEILSLTRALPQPCMILLPALFGSIHWVSASRLKPHFVVIDAAQTAFGHEDFNVLSNGAVLSCPRKATGLPDGAVLSLSPDTKWSIGDLDALPVATKAAAAKSAARALWAMGDEEAALRYNKLSEGCWPETPHRMTNSSLLMLEHFDRGWHKAKRRANYDYLISALKGRFSFIHVKGTPFSLPIFIRNRDKVLAKLKQQRIFATSLWHNVMLNTKQYPVAANMRDNLLSLPVDQRHDESDMQRIADALMSEEPTTTAVSVAA